MTEHKSIPLTRNPVPEEKAAAIRDAVQKADALPGPDRLARPARPDDADAFHAFLSDPAIHAPIYMLPRPLTPDSVRAFILAHQDEQVTGKGLLFLNIGPDGQVVGYSDISIWPEWAAGELSGALHPSQQGEGRGLKGAALSFSWMFETLGLDLIVETAALDNIRTAHLLDHLGFRRMGEIVSMRPDDTSRPSRVWEISRAEWEKLQQGIPTERKGA